MRNALTTTVGLLFALAIGLSLESCGKTIETAGPEAIQALDSGDYTTVENLAKSVKGLGNFRPMPSETSILERVAAKGNAHLVDVLIQNGANATAKMQDGKNAVNMAVFFKGDAETITVLLKAGADANAAASDGETPLMSAAQHGRPDLVAALLQGGADPKLQTKPFGNGKGRTALDMAKAAREVLAGPGPVTTRPQDVTPQSLAAMATKVMAGSATVEDLDKTIALLDAATKSGK